ncbi:MAG: AAA family ATPase, partial [Cyanobacteria bacterium J06648_11]
RLLVVESDLAVESSRFAFESPGLAPLQRQRDRLLELIGREKQRILDEVDSRIREVEARDRSLSQTTATLKQELEGLSALAREYSEIQQELSIVRENLDSFLSKREAFRVDAAQQDVPWQFLTPPTIPEPTSANVLQTVALGSLLGLCLGVGAAVGTDKLKDKLYSPKAIKHISPLSLLGIIPHHRRLRHHSGVAIAQIARPASAEAAPESRGYGVSPFHEAFRSLYANIRASRGARPVRSLVVSSALANEGKTTVAMYLAQAAASIGRKVLLVDADLRRPMLPSTLAHPGLTDTLADPDNALDLIRPSTLDRNLLVLPRGTQDLDPLQVYADPDFHKVLQALHADFDFVVYDSPPLLGLADAQVLAADTDGLLLVT